MHLFYGFPQFWGGGVAHTLLIIALVVTIGLSLGKLRIGGISTGLLWVLFAGLLFGWLGMSPVEPLLHFVKEFGLILFVYSIGMEAGPGFFSSLRHGGAKPALLSVIVIAISLLTAIIIHFAGNVDMPIVAGLLSGAVTNTPGLGAAGQAYSDVAGIDAPEIAMAYAVSYPVGLVGMVASFVLLRYVMRIKSEREENKAVSGLGTTEEMTVRTLSIEVDNKMVDGHTINELKSIAGREFVVSRLRRRGSDSEESAHGNTVIEAGDHLMVIVRPKDMEPMVALLGHETDGEEWNSCPGHMQSRSIMVTRQRVNGHTLRSLRLRTNFGVTVSRVSRAGVDLMATPDLSLRMGDTLTAVGTDAALTNAEKVVGNEVKQLDFPNLIPIFLGIALGCIVANIPFFIPGISVPLRLGLTGGPLVVAILIGHFGPKYNLVTYNTISANMMMREMGICLFLACVGLGCGSTFFSTVINSTGLRWLGYGALITLIPIIIGGLIGRYLMHFNFFTLMGVLAGSNTNPAALTYARSTTRTDAPSIGYSAVYPYAMFLRIITIQILIIAFEL